MAGKTDFEQVVIHEQGLGKRKLRGNGSSQRGKANSGKGPRGSRLLKMRGNQPGKEVEDMCFRQRDQHMQSE